MALFLAALLIASACGGTSNDEDLGPTATIATAPPTTRTATPTNGVTGDAAPPTSPPTIVFDDSAAAAFWDPLPEGMDPAEFQPDYLTREELTKYQPLPDPDPAAWDIPTEGITPEYAERVVLYNWTLRSAILGYSDQPDADLARALNSAATLFTAGATDNLEQDITSTAKSVEFEATEAPRVTDFRVLEIHADLVTTSNFPCFSARITDNETTDEGTATIDRWVGFVRDAEPNWLNPSGWRQYAGGAGTEVGKAYVECKAAEARS